MKSVAVESKMWYTVLKRAATENGKAILGNWIFILTVIFTCDTILKI